jgi:hypothetical protein
LLIILYLIDNELSLLVKNETETRSE